MSQIKLLTELCKNNANNHGWYIKWNKDNFLIEFIKKYLTKPKEKILSIGDCLALCHSELSEALEAYRDNNKEHFSEEIADEFIRLFHLCGDLNIDIEHEIAKKMEKNVKRPINHGRVNY